MAKERPNNLKNQKKFSSEYQPQEKWTEDKALALGNDLIDWLRVDENIFFEYYLLVENDYYQDLIGYLCDKFQSFFDLIEKAKKIQEIKLGKNAVEKKTDANMSKFILTNHHGYRDKRETELTANVAPFDIRTIYSKDEETQ